MKNHNHYLNSLFTIVSILVLAATAFTAWAFLPATARAATPEPDRIATDVVEAKAVAATLTAGAPKVDRIATGVAEGISIAATLTARAPSAMQTCKPEKSPTPTMTVSAGASYGATDHCMAKSGFATIELRNIVSNVKSLDLFVDDVRAATVDSGKYGCIYLTAGLHVFQWKNESEQKQSNARSFTVNGSDGWYTGSKRPDGIRNPFDAWLDEFKPTKTPTPLPSPTPTP